VTDANLVLGRYDAAALLGGSVGLDLELARRAIHAHVAEPLGMSVEAAAAGILRIVNVLMTNAVRVISVERGRDVRDFTLVAYGGAGPTHAAEIARELAIPRVLVPPFPGCASAFGAVISGSRRDFLRTVGRTVDRIDAEAVARLNDELRDAARTALGDEGFETDAIEVQTWLDVRYEGQAHELSVALVGGQLDAGSLAGAVAAFHALHRQLYGHAFDDVAVEIVNLRVKGLAGGPQPDMWWDWARTVGVGGRLAPARRVYMGPGEGFVDAAIAMRGDIAVEDRLAGPAVIHHVDSTILVPPGFTAEALPGGSLLLVDAAPSGTPAGALHAEVGL
jgi:N-methylhydantoinase A